MNQELVKWALGRITMNKVSGGDRIPAELFKILKEDAVKVLYSIYQQIWKMLQWQHDWKISNPKEEQCQRILYYFIIVLISHASKVMLKILQARFQQYGNFQMYKTDFKKAEEPEIKLPTPTGSWRKQGNSRKHLLLFY